MKKINKIYPLKDSCLYKITSKQKMYDILLSDKRTIQHFIKQGNKSYIKKVIEKKVDGKIKKRECETPPHNSKLNFIHNRIKNLLQSIETDCYLFSGKKGKSYIGNAKYHQENADKTCVKLDIKGFFPSVKFFNIYNFFYNQMKCSKDIATMLSKLCTYDNRLPTGCKMSMHLAYFSFKKMFDEINGVANENNCKMSLWVDDIIISGSKATLVSDKSKGIITKNGLQYHPGKLHLYKANHSKELTGVIVDSKGNLKVTNRTQKKINDLRWNQNRTDKELQQLMGLLANAAQIEPRFQNIKDNRNYVTRPKVGLGRNKK